MLAYCGLQCDSCPIHLVSLESDTIRQQKWREKIAEECNTIYGMNLQSEDINDCDGCKAPDNRLFSGCLSCEIRKCAIDKNLENCAFCKEYSCENLQKHFLTDPESKTRLEDIKK